MNKDVAKYYDSIADSYDESRFNNSYGQFIDAQERRILDRLIDVTQESQRLEIACGTGRLTNYATHGLDVSSNMMAIARQRHKNVEFREASATETGYPDNSFNLVYSFHLLMHLDTDTIRQIFHEVNRILCPGGRFIIDIPSRKRREFFHHKQASWHGGTQMSKADMELMTDGLFKINRSFGVMMLPVHKLPVFMRHPLTRLDYAMANGWLKDYSSYLVYELVK